MGARGPDPQWPRGRHRILRLQRPGGRTLFVTDGLSSPRPGTEGGGLGMELAMETDEPPLEDEYEAAWPARALEGAAGVLLEDAPRRETLEKRPVSIALGPGSFPESLQDFYKGQGLVVGVTAEDLNRHGGEQTAASACAPAETDAGAGGSDLRAVG